MDDDLEKVWEKISPKEEEAEIVPESMDSTEVNTRYTALRTISKVYKVLAIIVIIAAFGVLIYGIVLQGDDYYRTEHATGISLIFTSLIFGAFGYISLLAVSEILKLYIDLEENSRKHISLLKKILNKS